ncbi:hypothetical protein WJX81_006785 [Elliptochloris bilobata]|uniref:MATE family efflux transporter n=1 Tax=Elliptochloris bilobata TaxID=381761 RepID=A0AAW1QDU3_9CHLO
MALVDTAIVGRLGLVPLGAVGLSNLVHFFATVFFSFLLVVTTPRVADALAANDAHKASVAIAHNLMIAATVGVVLACMLWSGAPWLIQRFSPIEEVAAQAVLHLRLKAFSVPAVLLLFVQHGAFRGARDTRTPLLAGVAQNAVNLSLDLLLVLGMGVGIVGAAAASTAAFYTGAAVMTTLLIRKGVLRPADLRDVPSLGEVGATLRPGVPYAFCIGSVVFSLLTATNLVTALGSVALAAHTIVKQIIDFAMAIFGTFSTVAQTLVASSLGKGDRGEARAYVARLLQLGVGVGTATAAGFLLGRTALPSLFTGDAQVLAAVASVLPIIALTMPLAPCALALEGTVLGASEITWVGGRTVASAAAALGVLQLGRAMGWGLCGVWAGMVSLVLCNFAFDAMRLGSRWSPLAPVHSVREPEKEHIS